VPTLLAPRFWATHLLALVLVGAAGWLGVWQYDAWDTRRSAEAADLTRLDPVPLDSVIGPDAPFPGDKVGQPVVLDGTWVPDGTVYVSGREHDGEQGYWVVSPLAIPGAHDPAVPVVRGWVADPRQATAPPTGHAELVGWLQPPQGTGEADDDPADAVLPQLRIADVIQHVDQDLYGAYVVVADRVADGTWPVGDEATNDGTAGLAPAALEQLPDAGRFTAVRNLLYAFEWWVFAAFAAFVWWKHLQDVLAAERAPAEAPDDGGPDEESEVAPQGSTDDPVPSEP
jgi:cytochrome oxidase assembly protein ShyY1